MRKFYTMIAALLVSVSAIAQSSMADFTGDWTFTCLDNKNGGATTKLVVDMVFDYPECIFYLPDGRGAIYAFNGSLDASAGTITFGFQPWSYTGMKAGNYYQDENSFINDGGELVKKSPIFAVYDIAESKFTKFYWKLGSNEKVVDSIIFEAELYDTREQDVEGGEERTPVDSWSYTLVNGYFGTQASGTEIYVSLPQSVISVGYAPNKSARISATPQVSAQNVENFDVYYKLSLNGQAVVSDTKINPENGAYMIQVSDLEYETNYELSVWAVAEEEDYTSTVATAMIYTGDAPSFVLTAEAQDISYNNANIAVTMMPTNLPDDMTYTVSATSTTGQSAPEVTVTGTKATLNVKGLKGSTQYTFTVNAVGTDSNGVEFTAQKDVTFTTEATPEGAEPEIIVEFPEGSYSSMVNPQERYYAMITATPTIIAENVDDFEVYYSLYITGAALSQYNLVQPVDGKYTITLDQLTFSRTYTLEVWAETEDYMSEVAVVNIMTAEEPSISITSATAIDITETSATITASYEPVNLLSNDLTYRVSLSCIDEGAPTVQPVTTTETSISFDIEGLEPGTLYTYHVQVNTTDSDGKMYQKSIAVPFTTVGASHTIALNDISYSMIPCGAVFKVADVVTTGFENDEEIDVYFRLSNSEEAPQKAAYVTNGDESYYEFTFQDLQAFTPYTAVIFGGSGVYGQEGFIKGVDYKVNFMSGQASGVSAVEAAGEDGARYFNLQGVEIKNPVKGQLYIKVEGNKAEKVIE